MGAADRASDRVVSCAGSATPRTASVGYSGAVPFPARDRPALPRLRVDPRDGLRGPWPDRRVAGLPSAGRGRVRRTRGLDGYLPDGKAAAALREASDYARVDGYRGVFDRLDGSPGALVTVATVNRGVPCPLLLKPCYRVRPSPPNPLSHSVGERGSRCREMQQSPLLLSPSYSPSPQRSGSESLHRKRWGIKGTAATARSTYQRQSDRLGGCGYSDE